MARLLAHASNDQITLDELIKQAREYLPEKDTEGLRKAYEFALKVHGDRKRPNGTPYINHPLTVAYTLALMQLDLETLQAALLHGIFKDPDSPVTTKEVSAAFGPVVEAIVSGVTKINKVEFNANLDYQAENIRKMLLA
ncbi:MAG: HD domain-containing protein, partial [Desulfobulbaceae bacterium]|nr:HD domain-containing protein [Desulfobulbaceae bacterium]